MHGLRDLNVTKQKQTTMTNEIKYKYEAFSFKQLYHKHPWTKSKSVNTKVVVCNILHVAMEV